MEPCWLTFIPTFSTLVALFKCPTLPDACFKKKGYARLWRQAGLPPQHRPVAICASSCPDLIWIVQLQVQAGVGSRVSSIKPTCSSTCAHYRILWELHLWRVSQVECLTLCCHADHKRLTNDIIVYCCGDSKVSNPPVRYRTFNLSVVNVGNYFANRVLHIISISSAIPPTCYSSSTVLCW